jgi:hypothetical protein
VLLDVIQPPSFTNTYVYYYKKSKYFVLPGGVCIGAGTW